MGHGAQTTICFAVFNRIPDRDPMEARVTLPTEILGAINPLYSLSGLFVGALVGFTGVGGGSLMTPLLMLLFGIHPATARWARTFSTPA
jgi:hypothetical protein